MKRKLINYILFMVSCFLNLCMVVDAKVSVFLPGKWTARDYDPGKNVQKDGNYSLLDVIEFINDYLWFSIWFVCFLFVVINGIKLIASRWDEEATSKAMKALIWCVVWIVVCLSAYIIVNLAIRLFA